MPYPAIPIDPNTRLVVLTGAGVSAESGLATFRGAGGLWEGSRIEDVATPEAFAADPERVWRFYAERRAGASAARPNAAHLALADAETRMGERFLLATQNVDGLHPRAGNRRVVELHGSLWRSRCSACDAPPVEDHSTDIAPPLPACAVCGALMRPDIVWFGEMLDPAHEWAVRRFLEQRGMTLHEVHPVGDPRRVDVAVHVVDGLREREDDLQSALLGGIQVVPDVVGAGRVLDDVGELAAADPQFVVDDVLEGHVLQDHRRRSVRGGCGSDRRRAEHRHQEHGPEGGGEEQVAARLTRGSVLDLTMTG